MFKPLLAVALLTVTSSSYALSTNLSNSANQASVASSAVVGSAVYGIAASGQAVSAVAAIPLSAVGVVGSASHEIAEDLWDAANTPIGEPLPISDETLISGPSPADALAN